MSERGAELPSSLRLSRSVRTWKARDLWACIRVCTSAYKKIDFIMFTAQASGRLGLLDYNREHKIQHLDYNKTAASDSRNLYNQTHFCSTSRSCFPLTNRQINSPLWRDIPERRIPLKRLAQQNDDLWFYRRRNHTAALGLHALLLWLCRASRLAGL